MPLPVGTSGVYGTDFEGAMNKIGRGIEGLDRGGWHGKGNKGDHDETEKADLSRAGV